MIKVLRNHPNHPPPRWEKFNPLVSMKRGCTKSSELFQEFIQYVWCNKEQAKHHQEVSLKGCRNNEGKGSCWSIKLGQIEARKILLLPDALSQREKTVTTAGKRPRCCQQYCQQYCSDYYSKTIPDYSNTALKQNQHCPKSFQRV